MGNMLESDSSSNSDIENSDAHDTVRTDGDGMEFVKDGMESNSLLQPLTGTKSEGLISKGNANTQPIGMIDQGLAAVGGEVPTSPLNSSDTAVSLSRTSSSNSVGSKDQSSTLPQMTLKKVTSSPRELPSRDLLIAVRPIKCEGKTASAFDKFAAANSAGSSKQKNAKFVPYEPYTCAIRPMMTGNSKTHTRKSSDSSSVISQSSVLSANASTVARKADGGSDEIKSSSSVSPPRSSPSTPKKKAGVERLPAKAEREPMPANGNMNHNNHSTVLLKERLKMAEKEVNEMQSENSRLKKLLVDSMTGTISSSQPSPLNSNYANRNSHRVNEPFDNLNDEIEVWRSKFLSSCVLVEQLSKDNQMLNGSINAASELLKDLKNTLPLTPSQYELINQWLRENKPSTMSSSFEADANYDNE